MNIELPTTLTFAGSRLTIFYEKDVGLNKTSSSIVIEGTHGGFLSLANALFFCLNDLRDVIELEELPYVTSRIRLTIVIDESVAENYGTISPSAQGQFTWKMSESETCRVASEIHSLGYINNELHLDEGKETSEISVYCVVS